MSGEVVVLAGTAASIGFVHTVLGPDHYLPFIVLSRARQWSSKKTAVITFLCGLGHVLSSIVLGFIGVALGLALFGLETFESFRGEIAAWLLIAFGFTYFIWGIHRAIRGKPHRHSHLHKMEDPHDHLHSHTGEHTHVHTSKSKSITPWILFIIFIFGPCEPLIPILMYPAAESNMLAVAIIAAIFALVTITTMLCIVLISSYGLARLPLRGLEKYSHALAGFAILTCGCSITFLGL